MTWRCSAAQFDSIALLCITKHNLASTFYSAKRATPAPMPPCGTNVLGLVASFTLYGATKSVAWGTRCANPGRRGQNSLFSLPSAASCYGTRPAIARKDNCFRCSCNSASRAFGPLFLQPCTRPSRGPPRSLAVVQPRVRGTTGRLPWGYGGAGGRGRCSPPFHRTAMNRRMQRKWPKSQQVTR
jgi:hypothetical protein